MSYKSILRDYMGTTKGSLQQFLAFHTRRRETRHRELDMSQDPWALVRLKVWVHMEACNVGFRLVWRVVIVRSFAEIIQAPPGSPGSFGEP